MSFKLKRILEEFSKEFYDPRDPLARTRFEQSRLEQVFSMGIITDNQDPDSLGRVKVHLPQVASDYISDWCRIITRGAGDDRGFWNLPDIGEVVLVVFLYGDIHRPAVYGSMNNQKKRPVIADNEDNNIKAVKTGGTYLLLDDTPGEERLEASIKDGQIRVVIDTDGVHLTNELGAVNIDCRKLTVKGKATSWVTEKDISLKVGGNLNLAAQKTMGLTASGDITIEGSTIDLKGSTGVTAESMQIAVENDPVAGMDMHDIMVPSNSGLTKVPAIPHPYIGKLSDKLSSDVSVGGKAAATEGSMSEFGSPGHFPMPPGVKFAANPDNKGEVTGGCIDSVSINGNPAAVIGSTVSTCDDAGQKDHCTIISIGTVVTFPIQYPGQDPEQYRRDGGLPVRVDSPAVYGAEAAAYRDQPKSLSSLQWSASQIEKGEEVTLSCATSGVRDGAAVTFSIYPDGADPEKDPPLQDIRGVNKGSRAEVKWVAKDIRKPESDNDMNWFFTAWTLYCPKEQSSTMEVTRVLPEFSELKWFWIDEDGNEQEVDKAESGSNIYLSANVKNLDDGKTASVFIYEEGYNNKKDFIHRKLVEIKDSMISCPFSIDIKKTRLEEMEENFELRYLFLIRSTNDGYKSEESSSIQVVFTTNIEINIDPKTLDRNDEFILKSTDNDYSQSLHIDDDKIPDDDTLLLHFSEILPGKEYDLILKDSGSKERKIFRDRSFTKLVYGDK